MFFHLFDCAHSIRRNLHAIIFPPLYSFDMLSLHLHIQIVARQILPGLPYAIHKRFNESVKVLCTFAENENGKGSVTFTDWP